jgi:hypothetical protein
MVGNPRLRGAMTVAEAPWHERKISLWKKTSRWLSHNPGQTNPLAEASMPGTHSSQKLSGFAGVIEEASCCTQLAFRRQMRCGENPHRAQQKNGFGRDNAAHSKSTVRRVQRDRSTDRPRLAGVRSFDGITMSASAFEERQLIPAPGAAEERFRPRRHSALEDTVRRVQRDRSKPSSCSFNSVSALVEKLLESVFDLVFRAHRNDCGCPRAAVKEVIRGSATTPFRRGGLYEQTF